MNLVRTKTLIGALFLVLGAAGACSSQMNGGGSETNWLGMCGSDGDCSVGHCVCGRCTDTCERGDLCPVGLDTCSTNGSVAFNRICGTAPGVTGVCTKSCGDGTECAHGLACEDGVCVPASSGGGGSDGGDVAPTGAGGTSAEAHPDGSGLLPTSTTSTVFLDQVGYADDSTTLSGTCLPRDLPVNADGTAPCTVVNVTDADACSCNTPGLSAPSPGLLSALRNWMRNSQSCDVDGKPACDQLCACVVAQASGSDRTSCLSAGPSGNTPEWCYVNPAAGVGDAKLVESCPATQRRILRFEGHFLNSSLYIACTTTTENPAASTDGMPGNLGDPCIPQDEMKPNFSGYWETEINIESQSPSCSTGICLVNSFRGRVSCPYGQPDNGMVGPNGLPEVDPTQQRCVTTGPNPVPVEVPVPGQLLARSPDKSVYCSCRCDGPAGEGPFCSCPDGFECAPLVDAYGTSGGAQLAGSYCIKAGTGVPDPTRLTNTPPCTASNPAPRPLGCGPL